MDEDVAAALALFTPDTVFAVNQAGVTYQGALPHFATMHPELVPKWMGERDRAGQPRPGALWCPPGRPRSPHFTFREIPSWGGSSGLLAVTAAILPEDEGGLGIDKVVCAGVRLDKTPHFNDPAAWLDGTRYRAAWMRRMNVLRDRVRCMSGWTREVLGAPTADWLR